LPKRIAILTGFNPEKYKGGLERYILSMKTILCNYGYDVEILFPEKYTHPIDMFAFISGIKAYLKSFDLLIYHSPYGVFVSDIPIPKLCIVHNSFRKMGLITHNLIPKRNFYEWYFLYGFIEGINIVNADKVIVVSNYLENVIKELFNFSEKIVTIPNALDINLFKDLKKKKELRIKYDIPDNAYVGLFIGRNDATKGYDIFKKVYKKSKNFVYWIQVISSGGINQYRLLHIKTYKEIDVKEIVELYNLADFSFFPSRFEGFGYTFIESFACKTPAIITDTGIGKEMKGLFENIKLKCGENWVEKSFKIIKALKNDKILYKMLQEEGRRFVEDKFSMTKWEAKFLDVVKQFI